MNWRTEQSRAYSTKETQWRSNRGFSRFKEPGSPTSGMQRVLYAQGQRGFWMPTSQQNFPIPIHLPKFLTTFFLVICQNFTEISIFFLNSLPKNPDDLFLVVFTIYTLISKLLSGCPLRGHPFMTSTKNHVFDTPSPCPHASTWAPLPPCGRPHTVDMKYTPLSWNGCR